MSEGNIRKRSKNSYEISWEDGPDSNGKRIHRYETVKDSRKNAEARLRQIFYSRDRG